jgi:serine/threonine protein kinase
MDCDNVSAGNVKSVFGTPKYVAPEVYITERPDSISDRYSMAVFFYRLLVGGYPLEGQKTAAYIIKKGLDDSKPEVAKILFSDMALFAFDEKDKSNRIVNVSESSIPQDEINTWNIQAYCWSILPSKLKSMFQRVFSENLKGEGKDRRPTENQWIDAFNDIIQNNLVKCKCGKYNFAGSGQCLFCSKKLPTPPSPPPPTPKKVIPVNAVKYKTQTGKEIFTDKLDGTEVSSVFGKGQIILESVLFSETKKMMKVKNKSGCRINLTHPSGTKSYCIDSASAFLMNGTEIEIETEKSTVKLKVTDFNVKKP